jgi:DNA-directed RNA polymerase subunit RPC12/RpoP
VRRRMIYFHQAIGKDFDLNKPVYKETDVPCTRCGAKYGEGCKAATSEIRSVHIVRSNLYHRVADYQIRVGIRSARGYQMTEMLRELFCWLRFGHIWYKVGDQCNNESMYQCAHCAKTVLLNNSTGRLR